MRRCVQSVTPSGSLVAAGAGWGLGNDPALRTWGPLLSQVPAPHRPLALSLPLPYPVIDVLGPASPRPRGGDAKAARRSGVRPWMGGVCAKVGGDGVPGTPTPPSLGVGVHSQVLVKSCREFELRCSLFESSLSCH